ncbi:MAG: cation diffusion facilitator family transporter [Actinomycetota bacterium]|nr:cation diffusion facilitator family transporter [Actinomycetota bacterium]
MPPSSTDQAREIAVRRVLASLLVANLAVVAVKVIIGLATGALSVLGDAVHSSVDGVNNILGLAVVRFAAQAPDDDHPYGHAKFETLGALAIVVFLSVTIFELVRDSIIRLRDGGAPLEVRDLDLVLLGLTLIANIWVAWYEGRRGRELSSDLLLADAAHTKADVFITVAVIAGLFLTRAGYERADPILALIVAVLVARVGWKVVLSALPTLVDQAALESSEIRRVACAVAGVKDAYNIRSRSAGHQRFAELIISVEGAVSVTAAHVITDSVEEALRRDLGFHEVVVHVEPC